MPDITATIPQRAYDGLAEAAQRNGLALTDLAADILRQQGFSYANLFGIGVLTSAGFVARFTPAEYAGIITAAETDSGVAALVGELTASPYVALDDPRLDPGLALLVSAGLLAPERPAEIVAYDRPQP